MTNIGLLDDFALEKIMAMCSDRTLAYLLVSLPIEDRTRILKLLSQVHKIAIYAELEINYIGSRNDVATEVEVFWNLVRFLETQGEILFFYNIHME